MTTHINHDHRNAPLSATPCSGGQAALNRLPLYYSDDDTLVRAVSKTPGIMKDTRTVHSMTFIRLEGWGSAWK